MYNDSVAVISVYAFIFNLLQYLERFDFTCDSQLFRFGKPHSP